MNEHPGRVVGMPQPGDLLCQLDLGFGVWAIANIRLARIELLDPIAAHNVIVDLLAESGEEVVVGTLGPTLYGLNHCDVFATDGTDVVWLNEALVSGGLARWIR